MNKRLFSIALLISALPAMATTNPVSSFNEGDFVAMEKMVTNGEPQLKVKFSKSGKAKLKKLNISSFNEENILKKS